MNLPNSEHIPSPDPIPDDPLTEEWGEAHAESVRLYAGISAKVALEVAVRNSSHNPDLITEDDNQLLQALAKEAKPEYSGVVIPNSETNLRLFRQRLSDQEKIGDFFSRFGIEKNSLDLSPGKTDYVAFVKVLEYLGIALKAQETGIAPTLQPVERLLWLKNAKDPSGSGFILDVVKFKYASEMGLLDKTIVNEDNLKVVLDKIDFNNVNTLPDALQPHKSGFSSMLFAAKLLKAGMTQTLNEVYDNLPSQNTRQEKDQTGHPIEGDVDSPETLETPEVSKEAAASIVKAMVDAHSVLSQVDTDQRYGRGTPSDEKLHLIIRGLLRGQYYDEEDLAKGITLVQSVIDKVNEKGLYIGKMNKESERGLTDTKQIFLDATSILRHAIEEERTREKLQNTIAAKLRKIFKGERDGQEQSQISNNRSKPIGVEALEDFSNKLADLEHPEYRDVCDTVIEIYRELLNESQKTEVVTKYNPEVRVKETPIEIATKVINVMKLADGVLTTMYKKEQDGSYKKEQDGSYNKEQDDSTLSEDEIRDIIRSNLVANKIPEEQIESSIPEMMAIVGKMRKKGLRNRWEKRDDGEGFNADSEVFNIGVDMLEKGVEATIAMMKDDNVGITKAFEGVVFRYPFWDETSFKKLIASNDGPVAIALLRDWSKSILKKSNNPRYKEVCDIVIAIYEELSEDYEHLSIGKMFK